MFDDLNHSSVTNMQNKIQKLEGDKKIFTPLNILLLYFFFKKLAAIPVTAFVGEDSLKQFEKYIRLCFIKVRSGLTLGFYRKKIIQLS